jgi:UDP-N-acetylglucosamine 2-epimerase
VFEAGFPAIDLIADGLYASPEDLVKKFHIDLSRPLVIFTQHSVATEFDRAEEQLRPSLEALEILAASGVQIVATYPNNDAGGRRIISALEAWNARKIPGVQVHKSVGRFAYHGFLNACGRAGRGACVGNSSSGIKETPALGCPTVNIGDRQKGRLRAGNVLDAGTDRDEIVRAVRRCLEDDAFRSRCLSVPNPYGKGEAGPSIAKVLAEIPLDARLIKKKMTY